MASWTPLQPTSSRSSKITIGAGGHQGVLCQLRSVLCSRCLPRTFELILLEVTVRGIWLGPRLLESGGTPWARLLFLSATASSCWHVSCWSLEPHFLKFGRRPLIPTHS